MFNWITNDENTQASERLEEPDHFLLPASPINTIEQSVAEHRRIAGQATGFTRFDDWHMDALMELLEPCEWKAFSFLVRRTIGFNKEQDEDHVSQSQFIMGIKSRYTGERVSYGTGLGKSAIETALKGLRKYHVVIRVAKNDITKNNGDLYRLQRNSTQIDWAGLVARRHAKKEAGARRIGQAQHKRNTLGSL